MIVFRRGKHWWKPWTWFRLRYTADMESCGANLQAWHKQTDSYDMRS